MAVLKREEYFNRLQDYVGDDTSDKGISLVEDFTDTFNAFEEKKSDEIDWKKKFEDNDRAWRERYSRRFFTGMSAVPGQDEVEAVEKVTAENITVDDIFEEKEN